MDRPDPQIAPNKTIHFPSGQHERCSQTTFRQGKSGLKTETAGTISTEERHSGLMIEVEPVADRGVSGPWGPQFCGALCNCETERLPAGGAGSPPAGSGAEPRRQTNFGNNIDNWLKIRYLDRRLTHNSDLISDVVAYGKSRYPNRLYDICHLSGNHSHIIITCSRLATNSDN